MFGTPVGAALLLSESLNESGQRMWDRLFGPLVEIELVVLPGQDHERAAIGEDGEAERLIEGLRARHVSNEDFADQLAGGIDIPVHSALIHAWSLTPSPGQRRCGRRRWRT